MLWHHPPSSCGSVVRAGVTRALSVGGRRLHPLTKHRVFAGPGFLVAQEVGDVCHGGQVALTHDAWLQLRRSMDQAPPLPPRGASSSRC